MKERLCEYCGDPVDTGGMMHPKCYKLGDPDYLKDLEKSWMRHEAYLPGCYSNKIRSTGGYTAREITEKPVYIPVHVKVIYGD